MSSSHLLVALVPMKAHSERVSGKNFRKLHGKPLFHWSEAHFAIVRPPEDGPVGHVRTLIAWREACRMTQLMN